MKVEVKYENNEKLIYVNGENYSKKIKNGVLTMQDCKKAWEHIKTLRGATVGGYYANYTDSRVAFDLDGIVIDKLIQEHFSNPPLQFKELKKGDWVWVEPIKEWHKVIKTGYLPNENNQWLNQKVLVGTDKNKSEFIDFRFNKFYKKQLEE